MKTISLLFKSLLITGVCAVAVACADSPEGSIDIIPDEREIELSGTNPRTIAFTASGEWYARINYSQGDTIKWLNISPITGSEGSNTITITAKSQNYTGKDRKAQVEIKLPANNAGIITVVQPAVPKPRYLKSLVRSASGTTLSGPSAISLEYDGKTERVSAFSVGTGSQATRYQLKGSSIETTPAKGEGSQIPIKFIGDRISTTGTLTWVFSDIYTGIILNSSTVLFEFSYDNSDDKLLQKITRSESITVQDGVTLTAPLNIMETYEYKYSTIRVDSLIHIKIYSDTAIEPVTAVSDTVKYALRYAEDYEEIEDNNMTADIWNLLVFPQFQGTPFYSLTGYWMLGLTGNMQNNLPQEVTVESMVHSSEGMRSDWPSNYLYTYHRNALQEIESAETDITYATHTPLITMTFTYSDTIPVGDADEKEEKKQ